MYHLLRFSRLRNIRVKEIDNDLISSVCQLQDNSQEAELEMVAQLPDLEIKQIKARIKRDNTWIYIDKELFKGIIGSRIGPGIFKIIKGSLKTEHDQIYLMMEECCRGIILSFTKEDLINSPRPDDDEEAIEYYANMVKENIRLYNRCAAFAPGSRIVKTIKSNK